MTSHKGTLPSTTIMDTLPTEILIEIFALCSLADSFAPGYLSQVCNQWHAVVYDSPQMWTNLSNSPSTFSSVRWSQQTSAYITNSRSLPFGIHLKFDSTKRELALPLVAPLLHEWRRWKDFTITGLSPNFGKVSYEKTESLSEPSLYIVLAMHRERPRFLITHPHDANPEALPTISFNIANFPYYGKLCKSLPFHFVSIAESAFNNDQHCITKTVSLLSICDHLTSFSYKGRTVYDQLAHPPHSPPLVLPHLTHLYISRTYLARAILSSLSLPALMTLDLRSLNFVNDEDSTPPMYGTYEEGDSDDEAGDFSRSPATDRMTGMGIRRLIRNSGPNIRIQELIMSYTDLRTKDFAFIFDRLEGLKKFMIVGSDMSDNVIQLLSPSDGRVRLPMLEEMRLIRSPQLSGDALHSVFLERVVYTDNHPDLTSIKRLNIVDCDHFLAEHEAALARLLGERFDTLRWD